MKTPDTDPLDTLLRQAARDTRREEWARAVSPGLEARVQRRLLRAPGWLEALLMVDSWRPAAAAAALALVSAGWAARPLMDVCDEDWVAAATPQVDDEDLMDDDPITDLDL